MWNRPPEVNFNADDLARAQGQYLGVPKAPATHDGFVGDENTISVWDAVARAAYETYVTKDRAALEPLIADDFHFTSPLDNRIDRATYFKRCWPNSERAEDFDFIHCVPDGDRVFVTYEAVMGGRRFRNT